MANPFEGTDTDYLVLVNDEDQHSLWPESIAVPEGWEVAHGPDGRAACVDFVDCHWRDMRPRSLVAAMDAAKAS